MRNLTIFLSIVGLVLICACKHYDGKNPTTTDNVKISEIKITRLTFENHTYIYAYSDGYRDARAGLTHDPDCICLAESVEE
jgi:hypothetical protein